MYSKLRMYLHITETLLAERAGQIELTNLNFKLKCKYYSHTHILGMFWGLYKTVNKKDLNERCKGKWRKRWRHHYFICFGMYRNFCFFNQSRKTVFGKEFSLVLRFFRVLI